MGLLLATGMKLAEQLAAESGLSYIDMMERAGRASAEQILAESGGAGKQALILCGKGNNGGDGLVVARYLAKAGCEVTVLFLMGRTLSALARANLYELSALNIHYADGDLPIEKLSELMGRCDYLVDAVFGTGFSGDLPESCKIVLAAANQIPCRKYALDLPSGVDCDNGFYDPDAFRADRTFAFGAEKPAHRLKRSREICGEITLCEIGITPEQMRAVPGGIHLLDRQTVAGMLPKRRLDSNKGDYGKLLNIGGSAEMVGAVILSSLAAMRCGVGLVKAAAPKTAIYALGSHAPECIYASMKLGTDGGLSLDNLDRLLKELAWASAVLIGCGLSVTEDTKLLTEEILRQAKTPIVVDADGLNCLVGNLPVLRQARVPVVLTPHVKEMSRLTGLSVDAIKAKRFAVASEFSNTYGVTIVLKDSNTVIAAPDGRTWMNENGNSGLSKGGSGDLLAGMIGSLLAQGVSAPESAAAAVYLHGAAADLAASVLSEYAMQPTDVIDNLPFVFRDLF